MRVLYGLARVPATMPVDDPRLPSVLIGATPLRLNTIPLPPAAWGTGTDHSARVTALQAWLHGQCGDYDIASRRFITRYLEAITAHIAAHRQDLAQKLAPFEGLYHVRDWFWSALRPLPRAWWQEGGAWKRADFAFWDGMALIAVRADDAPPAFGLFWEGQTLPASPFRRVLPAGFGGPQLKQQ
jgi:hypothetical protein